MKKMVFSLSVLLAGYTLAQVESQVVGYNTVTIPAGQQYTMLGVNFNAVGSTEGVDIQDFIPNPADNGLTTGDMLIVWDTSNGYINYTLRGKTGPAGKQGKWLDSATNVAAYKFNPGTAAWLNRVGSAAIVGGLSELSILMKGEVVNTVSTNRSIFPGFNMISSVYPDGITLNATSGSPGYVDWVAAGVSSGDVIQIWDGLTYTSYTYRGATGPLGKQNKWLDSATNPTLYPIPMGSAVWYNAKNPLTFVEINPL